MKKVDPIKFDRIRIIKEIEYSGETFKSRQIYDYHKYEKLKIYQLKSGRYRVSIYNNGFWNNYKCFKIKLMPFTIPVHKGALTFVIEENIYLSCYLKKEIKECEEFEYEGEMQ